MIWKVTNTAVLVGVQLQEGSDAAIAQSTCHTLHVIFQLDNGDTSPHERLVFALTAESLTAQQLVFEVNGIKVAEVTVAESIYTPETIIFPVPVTLLNLQGLNEIIIRMPEAEFTGFGGNGYSGLAFIKAAIAFSDFSDFAPIPESPPAYP
jgi:hypothetical protein